ncbi:MAG TPA: hypothetical protein VKB56_14140 [Terriglobales bacterium]|nr:hypothetical protein [Terriglobales bacterium]
MPQEATKTAPTAAPSGRAASLRNLRPPWQRGQSGNPLGPFRHIFELFDAMTADLGDLTGIEHALLWQAAKLMAKSERSPNANDAVRLANAATRMLASVQTKRRRKPGRPLALRDRIMAAEAESVG